MLRSIVFLESVVERPWITREYDAELSDNKLTKQANIYTRNKQRKQN